MEDARKQRFNWPAAVTAVFLVSAVVGHLLSRAPGNSPEMRENLLIPMRILLGVIGASLLFLFVGAIAGTLLRFVKRKRWPGGNPEELRRRLRKKVPLLRSIGFFAEERAMSDNELTDRIMREISNTTAHFDYYFYFPQLVAVRDESRVYYAEYHTDDVLSEEGYRLLFSKFSRISRGTFQPESVRAIIDEERKTTTLSFDHAGQPHKIELEYHDNWMDPTLIEKLNSVIADSGYQFWTVGSEGLFLIVANEEEREVLRELVGWNL